MTSQSSIILEEKKSQILPENDVFESKEPAPFHLWLASLAYAAGRVAHRSLYSLGIKSRRRLPRPVICIGNLTVGGTGKTPFLIYLANEIRSRGLRPVILSRGYHANPRAVPPRIVSDGEKILGNAIDSGDEPLLLAQRCPGVPVVIGVSRYDAGALALEKFPCDLFLLDDGFQHEALARDADLVLWDARDWPSRLRQLPAGRLREGLAGLARATAIILTHSEYLDPDSRARQTAWILGELKLHAPRVPVFTAETRLESFHPIANPSSQTPIAGFTGKKGVLLSGLARPEGFESLVRAAGIKVLDHHRHPDHAAYTQDDVCRAVEARAKTNADLVLTTEKDEVKLRALDLTGIEIHAASLAMSVAEPERWTPFLDDLLKIETRTEA